MTYREKINWCIEQHRKTNHLYDDYLPYEFHLRMVVSTAQNYMHLLQPRYSNIDGFGHYKEQIELACYGHDLIEDTRVTYNDVKENLNETVANIIYALTNEKGKNCKERANAKYYKGIVETEGAVFVKLCDRIANVTYSKMSGSRMFEMYKKENFEFLSSLEILDNTHQLAQMASYLSNLFKTI